MASELGWFFTLAPAFDNDKDPSVVYFIQSKCMPIFDGADCMQQGYTLDFVHKCSRIFFKEMGPEWHTCTDEQFDQGRLTEIRDEILKRATLFPHG